MNPESNRSEDSTGPPQPPPPLEPPPLDADPSSSNPIECWQVGDFVWAPVGTQYLLPSTVQAVNEKHAQILLTSGDLLWVESKNLSNHRIRPGDRVASRSRFRPGHQLVTVREKDGDEILIQFDHGEQEWVDVWALLVPNNRSVQPAPPRSTSWGRWIFWLLLLLGLYLLRNFWGR